MRIVLCNSPWILSSSQKFFLDRHMVLGPQTNLVLQAFAGRCWAFISSEGIIPITDFLNCNASIEIYSRFSVLFTHFSCFFPFHIGMNKKYTRYYYYTKVYIQKANFRSCICTCLWVLQYEHSSQFLCNMWMWMRHSLQLKVKWCLPQLYFSR